MTNATRLSRLLPAVLTALVSITWVACLAARCGAAPRPAGGEKQAQEGKEQKPAKPAEPAVVFTLSLRSLDALKKLADDMHVDLPPFLTPAGIEDALKFIGPGGMASERPIGFVFFGSPQATAQTAGAFVLPVNPGAADLGPFLDNGGERLPGHPDTVVLNNTAFRRTRDNLMFGQMSGAVADLPDAAVADAVAAPGALAHVVVDLKAMREVMPEQFKAWVKEQAEKDNEKNAGDGAGGAENRAREAGRKMGQKWLEGWLTTSLERIDLSAERAAGGLRLSMAMRPVAVPQAGNFDRPALPAGCLFRVDLAFNARQFYADAGRSILKKAMEVDEETPADEKEPMSALFGDLMDLWLGGDATTMALAEADGEPLYYQVSQYGGDVDAIARLRKAVEQITAIAKKHGEAKPDKPPTDMTLDSYPAADGSTVTRVKFSRGDKATGFLDAVQKGRKLYVTAGESAGKPGAHPIERLLSAKADPAGAGGGAKMKGFASGSMDLAKVARFAFEHPNQNEVPLPEERRKEIEKVLEGQTLDWTARGDAHSLTIDMLVPKGLIENLSKVAKEEEK